METQISNIEIGDLVFVMSPKQSDIFPNQTKGIVIKKISQHWYNICITYNHKNKIQRYPSWMLKKVVDFPQ